MFSKTVNHLKASKATYLPAAGRHWLLPLYDPIVKLLGIDSTRKALVDQSAIQPGHHVLDIGCGTGTLITLIKHLHPDVQVTGLDPDPMALVLAKRKAEQAGCSVRFDQGFSDELPYPDAYFDRVFSSFMFHHLERDGKAGTLREVRRVLKPGGSLHLLDFGHPASGVEGSLISRLVHSSRHLKDSSEDWTIAFMRQAGFADPKKVSHKATFFGRIVYYQASTL